MTEFILKIFLRLVFFYLIAKGIQIEIPFTDVFSYIANFGAMIAIALFVDFAFSPLSLNEDAS